MRILLILIFVAMTLSAEIVEKYSVRGGLGRLARDCWVLVDLDNCFFQGAQALGHVDWYYDELDIRCRQGMDWNEALADFYSKWVEVQQRCQVIPVDPHLVPELFRLQKLGVKVMGLTHRGPRIASDSIRQVRSLGFDFSETAPAAYPFTLPFDYPALYTDGILFVSDQNRKSEVFLAFLDRIKERPAAVIFLDDKLYNIEDLESILPLVGIEYTGIHFRACEVCPRIYDREIADYQYCRMKDILSNEEARLLMKLRPCQNEP